MMNPMGGIDQQITQRSAQLKNDPNALMQKYGQSKDILDLIAAQRAAEKVKKEKEIAALQMQQNPATIADQLEQELVAGEKEQMAPALSGMKNLRDRTTGVAGVLAQKQQQQQKNMQRMGQQPQRPPQQQQRPQGQPQGRPQGQPMMAGGGLLSQRAPNLERMYGGGIVGFDAGGGVARKLGISEEEYEGRIADLVSRGMSREQAEKIQEDAAATPSARGKVFDADAFNKARARQNAEAAGLTIASEEGAAVISGEENAGIDAELARRSSQSMQEDILARTAVDDAAVDGTVDEALALGEEAGTAAAGGTGPSTLEQAMERAKQFGLSDDSAAPRSTGSISPEFSMTPEENANQQQQAQGNRLKQELAVNAEEALGAGGGAEGLEALNQGQFFNSARLPPEGVRRLEPVAPTPPAPEKELTYEEQLQALRQKRLDALTEDEEGLKDTRSNTRRLLDRLTEGAINASKRPAATTNRGALGSFGIGISEAVRAEETERKEGLAGIRDRRSKLLASELEREQALAQIGQGERGLDLKSTELANTLGINLQRLENEAQRLNMDTERYANALAQSSEEFAVTSAFKAMDLDAQAAYRRDTAALKTRELNLKDKATKARTDASKQGLMVEIAGARAAAQDSAREAELSVLGTFKAQGFTNDELNTKVKEAVTAIRTDRDALIASLDAIASGTGIAMPAGDGAGGGAGGAADIEAALVARGI